MGLHAKRYSDDELVAHLRSLAARQGTVPTMNDLNSVDGPAASTYVLRYGSLAAAHRAAGLPPNVGGRNGAAEVDIEDLLAPQEPKDYRYRCCRCRGETMAVSGPARLFLDCGTCGKYSLHRAEG